MNLKINLLIITTVLFGYFSYAAEINSTPEELKKVYGNPQKTFKGKNDVIRIYKYKKYTVSVIFVKEKAQSISYKKTNKSDFKNHERKKAMKMIGGKQKWIVSVREGRTPTVWITKDRQIRVRHDDKILFFRETDIFERKNNKVLDIDKERSMGITVVKDKSTPKHVFHAWRMYLVERQCYIAVNQIDMILPHPGIVIPIFEEELLARKTLIKIWKEEKQKNKKINDQYLNDLILVDDANFLREYVWTYLKQKTWKKQPKNLKLQEFDAWRKKNLKYHKVETHGHIEIK